MTKPERASKRGSRHREERNRRPGEKDSGRESERRRKDRDGAEIEVRGASSSDKQLDRPPFVDQSPLLTQSASSASIPPSLKTSVAPPSAPRAMAASSPRTGRGEGPVALSGVRERERDRDRERDRERERGGDRTDRDRSERDRPERERSERIERVEKSEKEDSRPSRERDWKSNREASAAVSTAVAAINAANASASTTNGSSPLSLRSRIGDVPSRGGPPAHEMSDPKKRTLTERDRDALLDTPLTPGGSGSVPTKRPRIRRDRYT